ncbi:cell wall-binding repeat-containing protein [Bacillus sp. 1P10SD]|uniref:cell wall-binding repeat-containing protein n=1 Tax=Bacillus sp. 1P10SD TaxID=3132265 RepID=UPI0039A42FE8
MRKIKKRTACLIITILIYQYLIPNYLFLLQPSDASAEEIAPHLTEVPEGYIGIYSISDLNKVRENLSGKYILMNDLNLTGPTSEGGELYNNGTGWTPIGSKTAPFTGTLDGNGFRIIGLHINMETTQNDYAGLFGYANSAQILNLGMDSSSIKIDNQSTDSSTSNAYAGGIVGYGYDITITNSYNTGSIQAISLFESYAGGLVGEVETSYNKTSTITNAYNKGEVNAKTYTGGIAGNVTRTNITQTYNTGNISPASNGSKYVGGIVGYGYYATITETSNSGQINYGTYGGGIAGYLSSSKIDISDNTGDLNSTINFSTGGGIAGSITSTTISHSKNKGKISSLPDYSNGGGIVGAAKGNSSIVKSYNQGDVTVGSSGGGITGEMYNSIVVQAYNSGNIKGFYTGGINGYASSTTIKESYNIGMINAKCYSGGIAGDVTTSTIQNSYNVGRVSTSYWNCSNGAIAGEFEGNLLNNYFLDNMSNGVGTGSAEGTFKKTLEEMKSPSTFSGFDFTTIWTTGQNSQYHFPELAGMELAGLESVVKIEMKSLPEKLNYIQGEDLDLTGASITAFSNFGNTFDKNVTMQMVDSYYKNEARTQQPRVTYEGLSVYFTVTVEKDVTPPAIPVVKPVTDQSTNVQGEAEPGSKITVKNAYGKTIGTGTTVVDGTFDVLIPVQKRQSLLLVTATDQFGNQSGAAEVGVMDVTPPAKPIVNQVTDQSTSITGTAEETTIVHAQVGNDEWSNISYDGTFEINIPKLKGGTIIDVWVSDFSGNVGEITKVTVVDETAPSVPEVHEMTDFDTTLTGSAEPESTVVARVDGNELSRATAGSNGDFSIPLEKQAAGTTIEVIAIDAVGNKSVPAYIQVSDLKPALKKLVGENRYSTAVEISKLGWSKADTVFLVNGWAIADGLTATPLASANDAPILLTTKESIPDETFKEIQRLDVKTVVLIGGTSVISDSIKDSFEASGIMVSRIGGENRYETSLMIAQELDKVSEVNTVYMAYGYGEPDALSIAAQSGKSKQPIILTEKQAVPTKTIDWLKDEGLQTAYFIGGTTVIAPAIINQMNQITAQNVLNNRLSGDNRLQTNAKVIETFYPQSTMSTIMAANSDTTKLVDALSAGPLAAKYNVPVLLVSNYGLDSAQIGALESKKTTNVHQIGGGIESSVLNQLVELMN